MFSFLISAGICLACSGVPHPTDWSRHSACAAQQKRGQEREQAGGQFVGLSIQIAELYDIIINIGSK